jgi:hypothetical protein
MYLTAGELTTTYYPKAATMEVPDVTTYLARANAYAQGVIGGPLAEEYVDDGLKAAVAMAFEILAQSETAQVDQVTGNITEAAPSGYYQVKRVDPLATVKTMLIPYSFLYVSLQPIPATGLRTVQFL